MNMNISLLLNCWYFFLHFSIQFHIYTQIYHIIPFFSNWEHSLNLTYFFPLQTQLRAQVCVYFLRYLFVLPLHLLYTFLQDIHFFLYPFFASHCIPSLFLIFLTLTLIIIQNPPASCVQNDHDCCDVGWSLFNLTCFFLQVIPSFIIYLHSFTLSCLHFFNCVLKCKPILHYTALYRYLPIPPPIAIKILIVIITITMQVYVCVMWYFQVFKKLD